MKPLPKGQSDALVHDPAGGLPRLREIMARLRAPDGGCPWDLEQTYASIARYTIEEAYEVADAIERGDMAELRGELGDLLLQVIYYAQMAEEDGSFSFDEIVEGISEKMVRRHPHVFGDAPREKSAAQQTADWEAIKARERAAAGAAQAGTLDNVPVGLPALTRAFKLQKRAARVGFDWPQTDQVLDKLSEEAAEIVDARKSADPDHLEEEVGDFLFVAANLARHLGIDPEAALRRANAKFTRRFEGVEARLAEIGKTPQQSDLAEMDAMWDAVKRAEKG